MIETLILAIVQGIAEFLPISSSGHLVILGALMGDQSPSATREIILHAGTLGSILVVYWRRIIDLLASDRRVILLLIVGSIPAAAVGITIKSSFESTLKNPALTGFMLLVTGVFLLILGRLKPREGEYESISFGGAFIVGLFQAFAILPGISRSGSTILGGRLLGLKNEDSVTFSFLLAIPAIAGAALLELKDLVDQVQSGATLEYSISQLAAGALLAFIVGIVALRWLIRWSRQERLHWFSAWCIPAGIAVLALFYLGGLDRPQ